MVLFANRVSACVSLVTIASTSVTPRARAASTTCWKTSALSRIGAPHLDFAEPRRARPMPRPHHLFRLALAAIGNSPQGPMPPVGDRHARVPELGRNAAVARILQHAHAPAVVDLPRDLAPELEVVPLI